MADAPLITGTDFLANSTPRDSSSAFAPSKSSTWSSIGWLLGRNSRLEGETIDSGVCYQAFFSDPSGNALAIHHRYAD